jgi:Fe-S-cluster containining protein
MVPQAGERQGPEHFDPATKCCTYIPALHNYLVGRILAERDPAMSVGRARVDARIGERVGVSPLGIVAPSHFSLLYGPDRFGKSEALRCPYYLAETGNCGVWKHRNTVCSTWFCKHGRGSASRVFWQAIEAALSEAERAVAKAAVLELDVGAAAMAALFPHPSELKESRLTGDLDKRVDSERYAKLWGRWLGKERELFARAAAVAAKMTWPSVLRLGGSELAARVRVAKDAYASFSSSKLPARLRVGPFEVVAMDETTTRVATYTPFDPIRLPNELLGALRRFDGGSTRAALATILEEDGLELDAALVQRLVDFEVLVDEESSRPTASRTREQ